MRADISSCLVVHFVTLQEANCTELLAHTFTSQSRGSSRGVAAFFRDAQRANAVVVLDGVELLLASVSGECVHLFHHVVLLWSEVPPSRTP